MRASPRERNAEPGRPVGGLVADLVGRLFHQEQVEQGGFALLANPATLARRMTGPVGGEKSVAGVVGKAVEHRWPPRRIGLRRALGARGGDGDRIVERAQQPGHVAQRAGLGAPLRQRPGRLALEVDDVGVARRHQHLAEMEIAMDARLQRARGGRRQPVDRGEQCRAPIRQDGRRRRSLRVGPLSSPRPVPPAPPRAASRTPSDQAAISAAVAFSGAKAGLSVGIAKYGMQFGEAPADRGGKIAVAGHCVGDGLRSAFRDRRLRSN